jgi:hypothetical protein
MATKGQLTGMTGVYLVAAQLSRRGFVVSPTSRSVHGVDLLASSPNGSRTLAIEVKTNARTFNFWLLGKKAKEMTSRGLYYAFVNIREGSEEYYIVPSRIVATRMKEKTRGPKKSKWRSVSRSDVDRFKDKWPRADKTR